MHASKLFPKFMNCIESKKMLRTQDIHVRSPTYVGLNVELWEDVLKMLVKGNNSLYMFSIVPKL